MSSKQDVAAAVATRAIRVPVKYKQIENRDYYLFWWGPGTHKPGQVNDLTLRSVGVTGQELDRVTVEEIVARIVAKWEDY
jgi:hypothetical protein